MSDIDYVKAIDLDDKISENYYLSSITNKTEQQKFLESLMIKNLSKSDLCKSLAVADIACGGGGASVHLALLLKNAKFDLYELSTVALKIASKTILERKINANVFSGDIKALPAILENKYDIVVCLQTLSWLESIEKSLLELVRITKPGGRIYCSSLFNINHDVDLETFCTDHSRLSSANHRLKYSTYSKSTIGKILNERVLSWKIHPFDIGIDLQNRPIGLGTYTLTLKNGQRIECSGGMILNWGFLEITV
jgi:ubiquinone/menaquinone biosynthesis C-methylase UbiE